MVSKQVSWFGLAVRCMVSKQVSWFGLAVRRWVSKQTEFVQFRFDCPFSSLVVVHGHSPASLCTG